MPPDRPGTLVFKWDVFVVAEFLLTSALHGPSALAEPLVNFWCPSISQEWLSNFEQRESIISSGQMDDKSPQKRAWFCSRDPFLYAQLLATR